MFDYLVNGELQSIKPLELLNREVVVLVGRLVDLRIQHREIEPFTQDVNTNIVVLIGQSTKWTSSRIRYIE